MSQAVVQDVFWIHQAACAIRTAQVPAYLVDRGDGGYWVVVALTKAFAEKYDAALRRLTRDGEVKLNFYDEKVGAKDKSTGWYDTLIPDSSSSSPSMSRCFGTPLTLARNCVIVEHPTAVDALTTNHRVEAHEMVLFAPALDAEAAKTFEPKAFATRAEADARFMISASH